MSGFSSPRLIVVDLDGTLVDSEPVQLLSFEHVLSLMLSRDVKLDFPHVLGKTGAEIWRDFGVNADPKLLNLVRRLVFWGLVSDSALAPNRAVLTVLDRYDRAEALVLTSQGSASAARLLLRLAIQDRFSALRSTQTENRGNVAKLDIIEELAADRGLAAGDVLWIEDASPEIPGARARGLSLALVRRSYNYHLLPYADFVIEPTE